MRKLASIRSITAVESIEGADRICVYVVDGWKVVDQIGRFAVGDLVVYCEIDSWIPHHVAPFLSKGKEPREFNGVQGERLRTVKLRGTLSQGLILPMAVLNVEQDGMVYESLAESGCDVTEILGIQKWEAPIPVQLAGEVRGPFPDFIPKTDQERIQNLSQELTEWQDNPDYIWEITEKLDGTSMTVYVNDQDVGVCSRNWNLTETSGNTLWSVARSSGLHDLIKSTGRNLAFQGELIGPAIQGNKYQRTKPEFYLFDIYDIDLGRYLTPGERAVIVKQFGVNSVPVIHAGAVIQEHVQGLLTMVEGKSVLNTLVEREGFVFKCHVGNGPSFKVISNRWLLKMDD